MDLVIAIASRGGLRAADKQQVVLRPSGYGPLIDWVSHSPGRSAGFTVGWALLPVPDRRSTPGQAFIQ